MHSAYILQCQQNCKQARYVIIEQKKEVSMEKRTIITEFSLCKTEELSTTYQTLISSAREQTSKAYAPYSNFHVGAAVLLENGEIIAASNQENSAYPSGLCAERVAMFYANAQYPGVAPVAIAIAAYTQGNFLSNPITPCGACRQVLLESEMRYNKDIAVLLYGTEHVFLIDNIRKLLPLCFEKSSLGR